VEEREKREYGLLKTEQFNEFETKNKRGGERFE
jgi:hypothetical protein